MNRILIIDDDSASREWLSEILTAEGYEILTAKNGLEGLELFNEHKPPVIILDLHMHEMDGIGFLKQFPEDLLMNHSIIVITSHGKDKEIETCFQYGVQTFLTKPLNPHQLRGSISRSLNLIESNSRILQLNRRLKSLNSLMHHVPDLIWECDTENRFIYLSGNVEDLLGYPKDSLIGTPMEDIIAEEDLPQFKFKFDREVTKKNRKILGLPLHFMGADGQKVETQLSSNAVFDHDGNFIGRVGVNRDMNELANINKQIDKISDELTIRINDKLKMVEVDESIYNFLSTEAKTGKKGLDFTKHLNDSTVTSLLEFAFLQQEDVPFMVGVNFKDGNSVKRNFNIDLKYIAEGPWLEGRLIPVDAVDQLNLMTNKLDKQDEVLKKAVVFDEQMQESILVDCRNLIGEILKLQKSLVEFAYHGTSPFLLEDYGESIINKRMFLYKDNLRLLSNKIHGLKGSLGFLIPEAKKVIHNLEEIPRALNEFEIVFTADVSDFLKKFIFYIQEMIEQFVNTPESEFETSEMNERIETVLESGKRYLKGNKKKFKKLLESRTSDDGKVRKRKRDEYLSVMQEGYDQLAVQVKDLYYTLSEALTGDRLIQGRTLYNKFVETHQRIDKVPLDLSRYDRLIPAVAEEYNKKAKFSFADNGVRGDQQFWNTMHEIFNHTLKNAVIHGLEESEERKELSKEEAGTVSVTMEEDDLHKYIMISDDGRGIDVEKIRSKAMEKAVMNPDELSKMSEKELLNLVFMEGFSTSETLDDNSGRGVGMNAVQEAMMKFDGSCEIETEPEQGTNWRFSFPKNNVTLSCFIVTIGDFRFAVLENNIEAYHRYRETDLLIVNRKPSCRYNDEIVPLLDPKKIFDPQIELKMGKESVRRILVFKTKEQQKVGIAINGILLHENLPILPMPKEFSELGQYLGMTMYGNDPVPVLSQTLIH